MKKILITGKNSYIGTSFEKWMEQYPQDYQIDTLDVHGDAWKDVDFSPYDVVFHVAGIAHADVGKVTEAGKKLYYAVNTELTLAVANKLKETTKDGRKRQFIFMSSIIVYGENSSIRSKRVITPDTLPEPANFYGDSKLKADQGLISLQTDLFQVVILRPPMIYGKGSKGNYQQLVKLALKLPVFPDIPNERSMLYIENLTEYICRIIDEEKTGIFFPQNKEYVRTSYLVREIAQAHGKKIYLFKWLNWAVYLLSYFPGKIGKLVNKAFGNLVYEKNISKYVNKYRV